MKPRTVVFAVVAVAILALVSWVALSQHKPLEVTVATARTETIESPFTAEAIVKGETVEIEPEIGGRVVRVHVKEGDAVSSGQALVALSSDELELSVSQARSAVAAAQERIEQAQHQYDLVGKQVESRIAEATAAHRLAKARLDAVLTGPRPEETAQAEQRVRQAQVAEEQARSDYERAKKLYEEGAIPLADFQRATTAHEAAQAETRIAQEALALLKKGATEEEKEAARAQVAAAQAALDTALASRQQVDVSEHDLAAARSAHSQARSALSSAVATLAKATVRAPFAGVIAHVPVKVGDLGAPGRPLMTIVGEGALRVEAEIGDQDFGKVSVGQSVQVTSASYPGESFAGTVERIAEEAVQKPGTVLRTRVLRTTIKVEDPERRLRPGMEVDVHGSGVVAKAALTVPSRALVTSGDGQSVWVVREGQASEQAVKVGAYTFEVVQIVEGLSEGDEVVVSPPKELQEGAAVKPKR